MTRLDLGRAISRLSRIPKVIFSTGVSPLVARRFWVRSHS